MAELFSSEWMQGYLNEWNKHSEVMEGLAPTGCVCIIGYGYPDEEKPRGLIRIESGKALEAGSYNGQEINWDLRAKPDQWKKWFTSPPGMVGLGTAVATGKLKFKIGDYKSMMKDPRMAPPFMKSFTIMGEVKG